MKRIIILIVILCFLVTGCSDKTNEEKTTTISVNEVYEIIENYDEYPNIYIVDVREKSEYAAGHIENSVNVPLSIISTISIDKDEKVIVYCQSGRRSSEARNRLESMGYSDVVDMGGISDWPYEVVVD